MADHVRGALSGTSSPRNSQNLARRAGRLRMARGSGQQKYTITATFKMHLAQSVVATNSPLNHNLWHKIQRDICEVDIAVHAALESAKAGLGYEAMTRAPSIHGEPVSALALVSL